MGGEPLVIVSAGDDRFAMPLAVALSSALRHLDPHRDALVFILDDGIDPAKQGSLYQGHQQLESEGGSTLDQPGHERSCEAQNHVMAQPGRISAAADPGGSS